MNIWLINHYAVPPKYYPLARTTNFAKYLMRLGHTVTVFAASSVHNSNINLITDKSLYREETVDDVHYVYIRCRNYQGNGKQRVINMFDFSNRLSRVVRGFSKPDAVLASSATPPACMAGLRIAKKYGARAVAEISDLWPLSFVDYGMISAQNPALIPMYAYEKRMYRYADAIIFTMEGGYDYIVEKGWDKDIPRSKVHYINNGVDLEQFNYNQEHYQIEDEDLGNPDIFKIVYTGSIRKVNNLGLLLDAAKQVKDPRVKFLVWGDGDELPALKQRLSDEHIENVVFKGKVEKRYVPYIVSKATWNFMHGTPNDLFRFGISPNKMFDYFAAGKPLLMDIDAKYNPVKQFSCGLCGEAEQEIIQNIQTAIEMPEEEYQLLCHNVRDASKEFDFSVLTQRLIQIIEEL